MKWLDTVLDRITMYRLLVYYLILLLGTAVGLSAVGILHYNPLDIIGSSLFLVAVCWLSNTVFAWVFEAPTNVDSPYITALILALIITPAHDKTTILFLAAAGGLAMASKYMLTIRRRHLFNPAAIAVVLTSFGSGDSASWWVGTAAMLPVVLIGGYLLARRVRRTAMVAWFLGAALAATAALSLLAGNNVLATFDKQLLNSALFFAAFVMLTEPLTSPTTRGKQAWYSGLVGALFAPQIHLFGISSTPELALVIGNIYAYLAGPRIKLMLRLGQRLQLSRDTQDLIFALDQPLKYQPGQYMEFTLQHPHTDSRGARRYFTLASSPTEPDLRIGIKYYQPGSSFKQALARLDDQTPVVAAQIGGNFTLPADPTRKLAFIAGGIGVTPFRSMVKYLLDTRQTRDLAMIYAARTPADLVYRDVFDAARQQFGSSISYFVDQGPAQPPLYQAFITGDTIRQAIPDYADRLFYISGPHGMVVGIEHTLIGLGVPRGHIKTDFFSGYA